MKTSYPPIPRVCFFLGLILVLLAQIAEAQDGWPFEPEVVPPPATFAVPAPVMPARNWYITGGTRYRLIQRVSADKTPSPGVYPVPFGPGVPGYFGLGGYTPGYPQNPTGAASDPPNTSGLWVYDNGLINPNNPNIYTSQTATITDAYGASTSYISNPGDKAYSLTTAQQIGRYVYDPGVSGAPKTNYNIGSFVVATPGQFTGLTFLASTEVNFTKDMPDGTGFGLYSPGFEALQFDNWIWTPYMEIGAQWGPFFQWFYSFSGFSFGNKFGKNIECIYLPPPTSFTDAYAFSSDDGATPAVNFYSATTSTSVTVRNTGGTTTITGATAGTVSNTGGTTTSTGGATTITGANLSNTGGVTTITGATGGTISNDDGTTTNTSGTVSNPSGTLTQLANDYTITPAFGSTFTNAGGTYNADPGPPVSIVIGSGTQTFSGGRLTRATTGVTITQGVTTNVAYTAVIGTPPDVTVTGGDTGNNGGRLSVPATDITITGGTTTVTNGHTEVTGGTTSGTATGGTTAIAGGTTTAPVANTVIVGGALDITGGTPGSFNFSSVILGGGTTTITGGTTVSSGGTRYYLLNPNAATRTFTGGDAIPAIEHLSQNLGVNTFENRFGGRTFAPFMFGELGASLGLVGSWVFYKIDYLSTIKEAAKPNNILAITSQRQEDNQWSFGGFAGVDLKINLGPVFVGCSFDYAYMTDIRYSMVDVQTFINPGGRSFNCFAGIRW